MRAEDAQGTPIQSHTPPSILVYDLEKALQHLHARDFAILANP